MLIQNAKDLVVIHLLAYALVNHEIQQSTPIKDHYVLYRRNEFLVTSNYKHIYVK